jgi:SAM-dependent MidA family methyltransferase
MSSAVHPQVCLPEPDDKARAQCIKILQVIHDEIRAAGGYIPFARYMDLALYAPGLGYYSAGAPKFGSGGDFITAPQISPLFSRCLAQQCAPILNALGGANILELGAGTGTMAADLLLELASNDELPGNYFILEISADLRERQRQLLQARCPQFEKTVVWIDSLPDNFTGVILANEVIDAMPAHRFQVNGPNIREFYVGLQQGQLSWHLGAPSSNELLSHVEQLLSEGFCQADYESELSLLLPGWINSLSDCLKRGGILLIDYGFPRHEFYHPERNRGTLMCHYKHHAHQDPFYFPGLQDITVHVDFTHVAECAAAAGLDVAGYTSQAAFLMNCGLQELLVTSNNPRVQLEIAREVKQLTMPGEMGEIFKAMALTRDLDLPLRGFATHDRRGSL